MPLGTSSAELGGEAHKQEMTGGLRRACLDFAFSMGNFWECLSTTQCPKPLADPWFLFPPPLLSFLLQPCLCSSIQLPELAASWGSGGGWGV